MTGKMPYNTESSAPCSVMTQRAGRMAQEQGDTCTRVADSFCGTAETNKTL